MSTATQPRLTLSSSPHLLNHETTSRIMLDVCIALIPSLIAAVLMYGWRALILTCISIGTCVVTEWIANKLMKRPPSIHDGSAVVTGMLLAFNVPSTLPIWMLMVGGVIAIVVVKLFFGGLGDNFMNPAAAGRIVLALSFAGAMGAFPQIGNGLISQATLEPYLHGGAVDAVATATPLMTLKAFAESGSGNLSDSLAPLLPTFLGARPGSLGEISALAILIGGAYLGIRRVISPIIPVCYVATVALIMAIAGGFNGEFILYQLMSGGLLLGAVFMATDYVTSPMTAKGRIIFGIGCGVITSLIRLFGSLPEGVTFSIVIMNLLVPHIERWTKPVPFGTMTTKDKEATV